MPHIDNHDFPVAPVPFSAVELRDCFWLPRLRTQKERTLPFALKKTEDAVENLRRCGEYRRGNRDDFPFPHRFVSSDLYKVMEGAAYLLMLDRDPALEEQIDRIIDIIAKAQEDDGYLYVAHQCNIAFPNEMGETPYSWVVHSHEVYNMGHMYEGAVAYWQATGKRAWLEVAEKSARHINRVFFEGDPNYNDGKPVNQAPGHQEMELALCKLHRATGNPLYLEMAKRFLDIRAVTYRPEGEGTLAPEYAQQHRPVAEQESAVGHAVRAAYMYAGMAEVGAMTGDHCYDAALDRIWRNMVDTRMHITGGLGAVRGIEGFGREFDLPNGEAYLETCAAIANVLFNYRMLLLHRDAAYFDVAEVALLNNSLAGVALTGDRFFYVNPLETDGVSLFNHGAAGRAPWFGCACCPSNIARIMPQVGGYMYARGADDIYLLLYGGSQTEVELAQGTVKLEQRTDYPFDGKITLDVGVGTPQEFTLKLRIPTWAREQFVPGGLYRYTSSVEEPWQITVNGEPVDAPLVRGFAEVLRVWSDGDQVTLTLPMLVKFSTCDGRVEANRNRIAVTRGPLVYCAEEADNGGRVQRFFIPGLPGQEDCTTRTIDDGPLSGMVELCVPAGDVTGRADHVRMVPYFAWNNRGNASMIVWTPRESAAAEAALEAGQFDAAKYGKVTASCKQEDVAAVYDGHRPQSSDDATIPRWTSAGQPGKAQTARLVFHAPQSVGKLGVYWATCDGCALPASWNLMCLKDGEWTAFEKYITDSYRVEADTYNVIHPAAPLVCDGLELRIVPQRDLCIGILDVDLDVTEIEV